MLGTGGTQAAELGVLAFALTAVLVPLARRVAVRFDVMSHPKDDRWHSHATPYLGGAAMAVAAATCIALSPERDSHAAVLVVGILVVAAIGLADDLHPLHPLLRVGLEAGVALLAYSVGIRVELVGDTGDAVITVLWLVGIANAFNLLDNADGALGSVCAVIGSGVAVAAALQGQTLVAVFAGVLVGVSAGFLIFNWPPASIFMGDTGSLFLGFVVAAAILDLQTAGTSGAGAVAAVLLAGGAIFDTTFVLLDRAIGRRSLWKGNTDHAAHRLLRAGMPPAATAAVLAAGTAWSAGWGLVLARDVVAWWLAAPAVVVPGLALMALLLRLPAGADDGHPVPPDTGRHAKIT